MHDRTSLLPFAFADPTYSAVTIGASGAIYGLLIAFALYYPETPILMFFLFPVPAKYFVMIIGAIAFLSVPRGGGVAHVAHLGGLVVGYLYLKQLRGRSAARLGSRWTGLGGSASWPTSSTATSSGGCSGCGSGSMCTRVAAAASGTTASIERRGRAAGRRL